MKILITLKRYVKSTQIIEVPFRFFFSLMPVTWREKISLKSNEAYSELEETNKFIFIHIPKCAGNAIIGSIFNKKATGHVPICRYKRKSKEKYDKYTKISVVRNPESRFVSAFEYLKKGGMGTYDKEFADEYLDDVETADEFAHKIIRSEKYKKKIISWTHFKPQHEFLLIDGKVAVDHIFQQENLEDNFELICGLMNQDPRRYELKKLNASPDKEKKLVSEAGRRLVWELYSKDYEMLGYE